MLKEGYLLTWEDTQDPHDTSLRVLGLAPSREEAVRFLKFLRQARSKLDYNLKSSKGSPDFSRALEITKRELIEDYPDYRPYLESLIVFQGTESEWQFCVKEFVPTEGCFRCCCEDFFGDFGEEYWTEEDLEEAYFWIENHS